MNENDDSNDHILLILSRYHEHKNIIWFWKNIKKHELLDQFAIYMLDNPLNDVDCKRVMSRYEGINSHLNDSLWVTTKKSRMFAMWNYIILCQ